MSEQQRVALVTGAAAGIGRELVLGLLGNAINVAAVDRTTQGLAERKLCRSGNRPPIC